MSSFLFSLLDKFWYKLKQKDEEKK